MAPTLVVGVGADSRSDDGAGPYVARQLANVVPSGSIETCVLTGDLTRLIDVCEGHSYVVVIDAARSDDPPGTIRRYHSTGGIASQADPSGSTHALGLIDTMRLALALGRLPGRVDILTIAGASFAPGAELSGSVRVACDRLVDALAAQQSRRA